MATRPINRVAYGLTEALSDMAPRPIVSTTNPTVADRGSIGQTWINRSTGAVFTLSNISANQSAWSTQPILLPGTATAASPTAATTVNERIIVSTFTGFTTAAAASQDFTINSSLITTSSGTFVQVTNLNASTNDAVMTLDGVTQAAGSLVVHTTNNGADALGAGDSILISVWIIS